MEEVKEKFNIDYGYITFMAFILNLRFNFSNKIEIDDLKKFIPLFFKKLKYAQKDKYSITMIIEFDDFEKFIKNNELLFTLDDKYIYINDNLSLMNLYHIISAYMFPFTADAIDMIKTDQELKDSLKLYGQKKIITKNYKLENLIKNYYLSFAYEKGNDKTLQIINQSIDSRNSFYEKVITNGSRNYLDDLQSEAYMFNRINPFLYCYPLDQEIDFDSRFEDAINIVDEVLNDPYLMCIFIDNLNPARYRMHEDLLGLSVKYSYFNDATSNEEYKKSIGKKIMKERTETNKCLFTPRARTQYLLFLKFIKCIEDIENKNGKVEELELIKYKLIYLLDNSNMHLMENDNIDKEYNRLYQEYLSEKDLDYDYITTNYSMNDEIMYDPFDFEWYQILVKSIIIDLFEGELYDEILIYKKLAFVQAYYLITKDKEIIDLLNNYSDSINFWNYSSFIRGNNKELNRRKK